MVEQPFALFLTWTTYGTWLPGDERGHVSPTLQPDGAYAPRQNVPGTPYAGGCTITRAKARQLQQHETVWLSPEEAWCAAEAMQAAAASRGWTIVEAAVMANHIHALIEQCPDDGPLVRRAIKGCSQAALSKHHGKPRKWYTDKGSDRYLHDHDARECVAAYIACQERVLARIRNGVIIRGDG